jgi:hypothetical protein
LSDPLHLSNPPFLERFHDLQRLPKRDRDAIILLIDGVLACGDVVTRMRRRAS